MSRFQTLDKAVNDMDIRKNPILEDRFYHIYNRGVNGEVIFKTKRNYDFFLKKIEENLVPVSDIYAYCLMSNHFHLLVKIKSFQEMESLVKVSNLDKAEKGLHSPQNIFSKQFSRVFNSYSQAFNKENGRHGSLIESPFKRKEISDTKGLQNLIVYIHRNLQSHGLLTSFEDYELSSYSKVVNEQHSFLKTSDVIEFFDNKENFIISHKREVD